MEAIVQQPPWVLLYTLCIVRLPIYVYTLELKSRCRVRYTPPISSRQPLTYYQWPISRYNGGGWEEEEGKVKKQVRSKKELDNNSNSSSREYREKSFSLQQQHSRVLCIVSFSFCVQPPTTAIAIKGYFTRFHFQTVSGRGGSSSRDIILVSLFRLCCIHIHAVTILVIFPILYWKKKTWGASENRPTCISHCL